MPTTAEIIDAIPVILSLVMIEGLLSVDNSLAIAAMARRVAPERRQAALNWGMAGAYGFRCLCLIFAAWIIQYTWIKVVGAFYLVYLMCEELTSGDEHGEEQDGQPPDPNAAPEIRPFGSVVAGILFLDASLSVDNVIAAIAMTDKLWAVYAGVGIGILSLRLLAGWCMRMIEKYPILEQTAFLLVGYVGLILLVEIGASEYGYKIHIGPFYKFLGIVFITSACLSYERAAGVRMVFRPLVAVAHPVMAAFSKVCGFLFWPLTALAGLIVRGFGK